MNTNTQTHTDLVYSFHFDQPVLIVVLGVLIVAFVVSIILTKKGQR